MAPRENRFRDTLIAALAMLVIAAMLVPLLLWLMHGAGAAGDDAAASSGRTRRDYLGTGNLLVTLMALVIGVMITMVGGAVWMLALEARKRMR